MKIDFWPFPNDVISHLVGSTCNEMFYYPLHFKLEQDWLSSDLCYYRVRRNGCADV